MKKNIIILALLTLTTTSYLLFNYNKTKNVQIGGDFKLTDHNNNEFIFSNSAKKISLVFFFILTKKIRLNGARERRTGMG